MFGRSPDRETIARNEKSAGDRLPYARHLDDATILTRDGMMLQVIRLDGLSFETADTDDLNYRKMIRETMLRSLGGSRFAAYHHVIRREVHPALDGDFPDAFSRALDANWQAQLAERRLYVNDLFLTVVRRPMQGRVGFADRILKGLARTGDAHAADVAQATDRRELTAACDAMIAALRAYGARRLSVYDGERGLCSEPLEFLSALFNGELRPVLLPYADIGQHLPYRRVSFGPDAIELGSGGAQPAGFAAILSIKDYPADTFAGLLDDLYRLPCEMLVSQSFALVDRQPTLDRMNLALRRMRGADDDSATLRAGLTQAKDDVAAGRAAFGEHHLTVMVKAADLATLDQAVGDVQSAFTDAGIIAVREDINMEAAFWAQFPGNFKDIARRALISTANFAGFASGHNFPIGKADGAHWGSAVTLLETTSAGPYHFNFHKGDLGNFTIIGPSGSGKTVVLNFLLAQARRFNPRIVFFDKDRGAEIFLRAIGGRYDALKPGLPTGFNPLQLADTSANRAFLVDWVSKLVAVDGEPLNPEEIAQIRDAVTVNYAQDAEHRQLRHFAQLFRGGARARADDLSARLAPWWGEGDRAWLFDNVDDRLDLGAQTIGFDLTAILDEPALRTPAMLYLFHRVEERLDGTPTLIAIDEGWKALDDDIFVARIKDWEKTIRKRNGAVGFATQSAADALQSRISSAIIEQAATQIFMVNPKAQAAEYIDGFGLTQHEFDLIRSLPDTSRAFLIKHGHDSVVARLDLGGDPALLTVLSGRETTVRGLDSLRAQVGDDPADWLPRLTEIA